MSDDWQPLLRAAAAAGADRFAAAFGELDYDDPFSIVLLYEGALDQPWGRVDMAREIVALEVDVRGTTPAGHAAYVALSSNGDVYFLGDGVDQEKIEGAGYAVQADSGRGAMTGLGWHGGDLLAFGEAGQLYRRLEDGWVDEGPAIEAPDGFGPVTWSDVAVMPDGRLILAGVSYLKDEESLVDDPADWSAMTPEEFLKRFNAQAERKTSLSEINPIGILAVHDGDDWRVPDFVQRGALRALNVDLEDGAVWACGFNGQVLRSRDAISFEQVPQGVDDRNFHALCRFRGQTIAAHQTGLVRLAADGRPIVMRPLVSSSIAGGTPHPVDIQMGEDLLYYFDSHHDVARWDGARWRQQGLPRNLMRRGG